MTNGNLMNRRDFLLGTASAGAVGAGGAWYAGLIDFNTISELTNSESDPMVDEGGLTGFSNLQRLEWDRFGELTMLFAEDHGSDFFTISHQIHADKRDEYVLIRESPSFDGSLTVDFGGEVESDGRDFPSDEFVIDFYTGDNLGFVNTVDEHLGSDSFSVPEEVELTGGTTISGSIEGT